MSTAERQQPNGAPDHGPVIDTTRDVAGQAPRRSS